MQLGTAHDDLVMARRIHRPIETLILQQLRVSGSEWEHRQLKEQATKGTRRYQVLEAYDGAPTLKFFEEFGHLMFDSAVWKSLVRRSQAMQRELFRFLARGSAACFQLVHVRHRTWPYRTFDLLRNERVAQELRDTPECVLDVYTANFRTHYWGDLGGAGSKRELQAVAQFADTDTASAERLHSENQRRAKFRVWTHLPT